MPIWASGRPPAVRRGGRRAGGAAGPPGCRRPLPRAPWESIPNRAGLAGPGEECPARCRVDSRPGARAISNSGMAASVCSRVLRAWSTSSSPTMPTLRCPSTICKRLALQGDVLLGVLDSLLGRAIGHVIRRHVAQERDQHVVVVLDRGIQGRGIGFDGPPQAAPEVDLPTEVEPVVPLPVPAFRPR